MEQKEQSIQWHPASFLQECKLNWEKKQIILSFESNINWEQNRWQSNILIKKEKEREIKKEYWTDFSDI